MMVTVTGAVWLSEPDVPVTIRVTCDADICAFELLELPPHPSVNIETTSSKPSALVQKTPRVSRFRKAKVLPNKPNPGNNPTPIKL